MFRSIIESINKGEKVTFQDVKTGFYSDNILKSQGREIKINSYQDSLIAININYSFVFLLRSFKSLLKFLKLIAFSNPLL